MKPRDAFTGPPRILDYRTDPTDDTVAFPISRRSRGIDVFTTLAYLDPNTEHVYAQGNRILHHAVETLGLMNNRNLAIPRTTIQITGQLALVEHVHFGSAVTMEDIEHALEIANHPSGMQAEKLRLTSAIIDTGTLAGYVIETRQRNEFVTATNETLQAELLALTERHYDL